MWQITAYPHSTGQEEDYLVSVYKSYQGKQHKNNRKKMKALMFDIFLSQYLVHARPQNSFGFLSTFVDNARRSFTNFKQKGQMFSANTLHRKQIVPTNREDSSIETTFPHSGKGGKGFTNMSRTGLDPNGFMD